MQSQGLLKGLFRKKQPAKVATSDEKYDLTLICSYDLLEIFTAHLFGLYFMEAQGCECYDPQDGIEYKTVNQIENTMSDIIDEMKKQLSKGVLELHSFDSWS